MKVYQSKSIFSPIRFFFSKEETELSDGYFKDITLKTRAEAEDYFTYVSSYENKSNNPILKALVIDIDNLYSMSLSIPISDEAVDIDA